jgi:hypothetical protein
MKSLLADAVELCGAPTNPEQDSGLVIVNVVDQTILDIFFQHHQYAIPKIGVYLECISTSPSMESRSVVSIYLITSKTFHAYFYPLQKANIFGEHIFI